MSLLVGRRKLEEWQGNRVAKRHDAILLITFCEHLEKMCRLKQNILSVPIIVQSKLCSFFATLTRDEVEWVEMEVEIGDSCISM